VGRKIFQDKTIELDGLDGKGPVSFTLADPNELKALKRALDFNGFPYQGDSNNKLVKLSPDKFIDIFLKYYPGLRETLKDCLAEHLKTEAARSRVYNAGLPFDYKAKQMVKALAPHALTIACTAAGIGL
jgi:hypothetical protein